MKKLLINKLEMLNKYFYFFFTKNKKNNFLKLKAKCSTTRFFQRMLINQLNKNIVMTVLSLSGNSCKFCFDKKYQATNNFQETFYNIGALPVFF